MNTKSNSVSAEIITDKILNSKGNFVKASWKSNPTPAASFKKEGVILEKHTVSVVRAGINYANLSAVKNAIEDGERGEVEELPWGRWDKFPYTIKHTSKGSDEEVTYIRLYPTDNSNHSTKSMYFMNGAEVSKELFASYLTPSESRKLLEPTEKDRPLCFTIKYDNILDIVDQD